jgi:hypothetical protein
MLGNPARALSATAVCGGEEINIALSDFKFVINKK